MIEDNDQTQAEITKDRLGFRPNVNEKAFLRIKHDLFHRKAENGDNLERKRVS